MLVAAASERNNFTALRLSLALMVVLGHAKLLSGTPAPGFPFNLADAAVASFFVVSGYLITGSYERCHGVWAFYVRRIFRLYPLYLFVVAVQTAAMLLLLPSGPFSEPAATLRYFTANALLLNFVQYDIGGVLSGLHNPGINPSLWTLKIEIGYYLIVPLLHAATRRWQWRFLAAVFVASVIYDLTLRHFGLPRLALQLPGQLQYFVMGTALYRCRNRITVNRWLSAVMTVAFLAMWTLLHPIPDGLRPLLVAAFVHSVALGLPPLRWRTDLSYGVYLLHGPIIQLLLLRGLFHDNWLCIGSIVAAVLTLAWATERLIERPGTELGRTLSLRLAGDAGVAAGFA